MLREKMRRKQAIVERQEEELRLTERSLGEITTSSKQTSIQLQDQVSAYRVRASCILANIVGNTRLPVSIQYIQLLVCQLLTFPGMLMSGDLYPNINLYSQEDNKALRSKLGECTKQLQCNGQMIRWLNDQVRNIMLERGVLFFMIARIALQIPSEV